MTVGYGLNNDMFNTQRINFHSFEGNKNGSPKEHKFRVLPAYAPGKLFHKVGLHWGYKKPDGKMSAITCSLESANSCPICDKINELKGQLQNIDAALTTEFDPQARAKLEEQKKEIDEYIGDHRRKPMYLWNIITEDGSQKVLQLSWNGHDPLFEKIKFIFTNQGIDVTNVQSNVLMYCNRSGVKAKTRYQYEMLSGFEKDFSQAVKTLTDLSKVYVAKPLEWLQQVVQTETVPVDQEDPNDRKFEATPITQTSSPAQNQPANSVPQGAATQASAVTNTPAPVVQVQNEATPITQTSSPAQNQPANPPVQNEAIQTSSPEVQPTVVLNEDQDKNLSEMMAALQQ